MGDRGKLFFSRLMLRFDLGRLGGIGNRNSATRNTDEHDDDDENEKGWTEGGDAWLVTKTQAVVDPHSPRYVSSGHRLSIEAGTMTDKMPVNPLLQGLASRAMPEPCSVVIFGATGDLTHRKLVPALYNLAADGDLPPGLSLVGFARRDKNDEIFRTELEEAARKFSRQTINDDLWKNFASAIYYHRSEFSDVKWYHRLRERLK